MGSPSGFPLALKIFFFSLVTGVGGGYGGYRLGFILALRFWRGENPEAMAVFFGMLAALVVGVCSAITGGVLAGRVTKS